MTTSSSRELIVEADGGSRGNPGPAGYGAVVLDPVTGETLAEAAEYIGVATNNVAEYKGLVAGLTAARALFPDATVHVRMDSKLVVEQMSGRWKIKHPDMKPLAAEAGRVFPAGRVRYEWIPRELNKHADRLANEAMDAGKQGRQWEPSGSTAALDAVAARNAAALPPSGPPGDAAAGAARARAALATRTSGAPAEAVTGSADVRGDGLFAAEDAGASSGDFEAEAGAAAPTGHAARVLAPTAAVPAEPTVTAPAPAGSAAPRQGWAGPDMGAPATFVLLRHGETALTPEKRFSGSGGTDPELSAAGLRQAEAVAAALAARGTIQEIVSSPLTRCRQTAAAVAARLGLDVQVERGLRETDFGAWEGLTFGEVRERYPNDLDDWLASPKAAPTGGGESFAAVARRVAATRDRLTAAHAGRTVLLVTHVTPIKTLVRLALGAPPESLFKMELSAASISAVAYYADGNASVRLLNDTSHLR
ncbi:bifunctional RNase H/acid phosphatase [Streptomyces venezuelae]|uniref:bifunctional RNase H/acid phosphatase n=1 Tax=Streptomyces gardneri TaxID=66892 RepID=UPI0006BDC2D0|nr:bifunctional RNase H/acid phosphatase [Streptomyces gardneri]ALO07969.1 bifunctional RNase H/acid phosphatase [Streptomyces venezuelae]QPK45255.1 bifunctional RNase H/acid phosphatase [Streptomyces gardneri]WRK36574.1 bifunctional RNase H/acid phosphatase [Streptomyces venezuelae]CUM41690.1 FIG006762: Phosphoglycerate mutase family [Streptomyces venezuelae]